MSTFQFLNCNLKNEKWYHDWTYLRYDKQIFIRCKTKLSKCLIIFERVQFLLFRSIFELQTLSKCWNCFYSILIYFRKSEKSEQSEKICTDTEKSAQLVTLFMSDFSYVHFDVCLWFGAQRSGTALMSQMESNVREYRKMLFMFEQSSSVLRDRVLMEKQSIQSQNGSNGWIKRHRSVTLIDNWMKSVKNRWVKMFHFSTVYEL